MEMEGFSQSRDLEMLNAALTQAGRKPLSASGLETKGRHKWLLIRIYHLNASFRVLSAVFPECRQQRNALGGGGCKRRVAARCDGRITLLLDHLGPAKGCLMQNPGLRDPTAGSKNVQLATNSKLKSRGKKG